jgi:hypothetical protein
LLTGLIVIHLSTSPADDASRTRAHFKRLWDAVTAGSRSSHFIAHMRKGFGWKQQCPTGIECPGYLRVSRCVDTCTAHLAHRAVTTHQSQPVFTAPLARKATAINISMKHILYLFVMIWTVLLLSTAAIASATAAAGEGAQLETPRLPQQAQRELDEFNIEGPDSDFKFRFADSVRSICLA